MFCNECGSRIPEGAEFCPECGNKIRKIVPRKEEVCVDKSSEQPGYDASISSVQPKSSASVSPQPMKVASTQPSVMLQCLAGTHKGKLFPLQGEMMIGSLQGQVHIVLQDAYVSRRHLSIRFNAASNCFEVKDQSTNGTFFENGTRLKKNVYTSCPRGTVIHLGSSKQQFKLI